LTSPRFAMGTLALLSLASPARADETVHPVSERAHSAGIALIGIGVVSLVAGDVMSDVFLAFDAAQLVDHTPPPGFTRDMIIPGLTIAGVGLAALLTGGALYLSTRHPSDVTQATRPPSDPSAPATATVDDRSARLPVWRDDVASGPAMPRTLLAPLFSARF